MRRRVKHRLEEDHKKDRWLVSYADFITLLFAFFVVMYSISSVNEGKYRVLSDSISSAFDPAHDGLSIQLKCPLKPPIIDHDVSITRQYSILRNTYTSMPSGVKDEGNLRSLASAIEQGLSSLINKDIVSVTRNNLWIEVEIKSSILFPSGSSVLSEQSRPLLNEISSVLRKSSNRIQVEGFTDNLPITTNVFPSNWELSASRAASVVHLLSSNGIAPERLSATGYGEYRPIASNLTALGRSKNRRVNIVVLSNALTRNTGEIK